MEGRPLPACLTPTPSSSPSDYSPHLLGDIGCCVSEQDAPLSAAPVVQTTALIFISDSGSQKSKMEVLGGGPQHPLL